jgi:hypothetical protein
VAEAQAAGRRLGESSLGVSPRVAPFVGGAMEHVYTFLWAVVGLFLVLALRDACAAPQVARGLEGRYGSVLAERPKPLVHPRGIRRARGVGRLGALDVADWSWAHGGPIDLERIPGVGPVTAGPLREVAVAILTGERFRLHSPAAAPR